MYEKRFLWGVDGVIEVGMAETGALLGGVCERVPSWTFEFLVEPVAL